jgi:hypothetical protein
MGEQWVYTTSIRDGEVYEPKVVDGKIVYVKVKDQKGGFSGQGLNTSRF